MRRLVRDALALILGITLGLLIGEGAWLAFAQTPAPAPAGVPDWVLFYTQAADQGWSKCRQDMAQEQDRNAKLTKELADAKAALAKQSPEKK